MIEDTDDNRAVIETIESYREALEQRDAVALIELVHPNYSNGRANMARNRTAKIAEIRSALKLASSIKMTIRYQKMIRDGPDKVRVMVYLSSTWKMQGRTRSFADVLEYVLELEGGRWLFITGM